MNTPFHMSLPCLSVKETKNFYINNIGATYGRNTQNWIDINLFGHQITFIKAKKLARPITLSEFELYPDEWNKICTEQEVIKFLEGGKKIVNMDINFYDKEISGKGAVINRTLLRGCRLLYVKKIRVTLSRKSFQNRRELRRVFFLDTSCSVSSPPPGCSAAFHHRWNTRRVLIKMFHRPMDSFVYIGKWECSRA